MAYRTLAVSNNALSLLGGCGASLLKALDEGQVKIILLNPGSKDERILKSLGFTDVFFINQGFVPLSGKPLDLIKEEVVRFCPKRVFLPSPFITEREPLKAARAFIKALKGRFKGILLFYETHPTSFVNTVVDASQYVERKLKAIKDLGASTKSFELLMRLRGTLSGIQIGEAFLEHHWEGEEENFFENYPLVSVILRANRNDFLKIAFESLFFQTYDFFQCVLVWHGEKLDLPKGWEMLDLKVVEGTNSRGKNLNLGIENSSGDYICFLDQDDIFYPNHLEELLASARAEGVDIAFSSCRVTRCVLEKEGVRVLGEERLFPGRYRKGRILLENYIPIISVIAKKEVFRNLSFNEDLGAYEDWLFLAEAEILGMDFLGIGKVTCEYRIFGESFERSHEEKGYQEFRNVVLGEIAKRLSGEHLQSLADYHFSERSELEEKLGFYRATWKALREREKELKGREYILKLLSPTKDYLVNVLGDEPRLSIVLCTKDPPLEFFLKTLESIESQSYRNFDVCIADDGSTFDVERYIRMRLKGIKVKFKRLGGVGISKAYNAASSMAGGSYLVFLDHDDQLEEDTTFYLAASLSRRNPHIIYTDSQLIDPQGKVVLTFKKPDWSPETLISYNYINHLVAVEKEFFEKVKGFNSRYDGVQDWEFLLRVSMETDHVFHIRKNLYRWQSRKGSTAYRVSKEISSMAEKLLKDFLKGLFHKVEIKANPKGPGFLFNAHIEEIPVDVVILTKKSREMFRRCIEGVLKETNYRNLKVFVMDGGGYAKGVLKELGVKDAYIEETNSPFNWSLFNNRLSSKGNAPLILFLNDDVEVRDPNWLRSMVKFTMIPKVACVGALLLFPNGSIQHNGIATDEVFVATEIRNMGVRGEFSVPRNVSAVTGACMLVKRDVFEDLGGFDESLAVSYNDVDFCLRLRKKGFRIVQNPEAILTHHQAATRGYIDTEEKRKIWEKEMEIMRSRWGSFLEERFSIGYEAQEPPHIIFSLG